MGISFANKSVCQLQIHDHACLIYESEDDWLESIVPFLVQGLQQKEKCIYGLNHHSREQILEYLRETGIDADAALASGQLAVLDQKAFPENTSLDRLTQIGDFYIAFLDQCLAEGYTAIRFTCESMYTMTGISPTSNLVETNSRCNSIIFPHYPIISLCQYDRWQTEPSLLKEAIISHPIIIKNNVIYQNFSWIPDEDFLAITREHWETEHWLKTIRMENRERETMQMLQQTVERSAQPMFAVNLDGKLLAYNDALCELVGLSDYQMQHLPQLIPEWNAYFTEIIQEIEPGGSFHRLERQFRTQDGRFITLEIRALKKYTMAGNTEFYYGSITDISAQLAAEAALRKSEEKYRLIAENAYDLISIMDKDLFTYKYLSPSHERLLGYKVEELLGHNGFDYVHPEDVETSKQIFLEGIQKSNGRGQFRWRTNLGGYRWFEAIGKLIEQDEYSGDILLVTRDISEKINADLVLKKELEYKNYLIDSMNEVFVTYDISGCITFVNRSVIRVLGYEPQELIGAHVLDLLAPCVQAEAAMQIENRLVKGETGTFETTVFKKNGSECLVRIKSSPIIENSSIAGSMLLLEDISEARQLEREMARVSQFHTIGEIAAGIGHEIRNPMTTVKGFLQIMGEHEDFKHHQPYFNIMLEELERANDIISEFLALAKNKRVDLKLRDLNDIITAIYPLLQADATLSDKGMSLHLLEDIPEILLDEKEIRQLLINLVRNGLEAMEAGGNVYISTHLDGRSVILSVRDEGKGIAPEVLENLGTPFVTTKESGTGLGLAVCYSIAARHQASIDPISDHSGTTFEVRFTVPDDPLQLKLPLK